MEVVSCWLAQGWSHPAKHHVSIVLPYRYVLVELSEPSTNRNSPMDPPNRDGLFRRRTTMVGLDHNDRMLLRRAHNKKDSRLVTRSKTSYFLTILELSLHKNRNVDHPRQPTWTSHLFDQPIALHTWGAIAIPAHRNGVPGLTSPAGPSATTPSYKPSHGRTGSHWSFEKDIPEDVRSVKPVCPRSSSRDHINDRSASRSMLSSVSFVDLQESPWSLGYVRHAPNTIRQGEALAVA